MLTTRSVAATADANSTTLSVGNVQLDLAGFRTFVDDRPILLSYQEFELLRLLAGSPGRIIAYDDIVRELWGDVVAGTRRRLSVVVCRLRTKLAGAHPYNVRTVRGRGYGLTVL